MRSILKRYYRSWSPIALRLGLGTVVMAYGWDHLNGPLGTPAGFNIESWGWPYPVFWAWAVALVEVFGGLLIIIGLFTRRAATLIACVLLVAILKVKTASSLVGGFELEFSLLMIAVALMLSGPGRLSVDVDVLGKGVLWRAALQETRAEDEAPAD